MTTHDATPFTLPPQGEALLLLRTGLGISLRQAAVLMKLTAVDLGRLERDKTTPIDLARLGVATICLLKPTVEEIAAGGERLRALVERANRPPVRLVPHQDPDATEREVDRLRGYVEKLKLDVSGLKGTIGEQVDHIHALQAEVAHLKRKDEATKALVQETEKKLAAANKDLGQTRVELGTRGVFLTKAEQERDAADEKSGALLRQLDLAERARDGVCESLEAVEQERDAALVEIATLRRHLEYSESRRCKHEHEQPVRDLTAQVTGLLWQVKALDADRQAARAEVAVLRASRSFWTLTERECLRTGDLAGMEAETARRDEHLNGVYKDIHALQDERDHARAEVERLKATNESLKAECEKYLGGWPNLPFQLSPLLSERSRGTALIELFGSAALANIEHRQREFSGVVDELDRHRKAARAWEIDCKAARAEAEQARRERDAARAALGPCLDALIEANATACSQNCDEEDPITHVRECRVAQVAIAAAGKVLAK